MELELEILRFILANQGSADTEELVYNLCDSSFLTELLCKSDRFVLCPWRSRLVVHSRLTVCRKRDCPACEGLHLCLGFLYSGTCRYRGGCSFSHELQSEDNMEVLRDFGLETLSRTELCLLLLQSNNTLLPPICLNYNSRGGCQEEECQWLHVCERFLTDCSRDCSCPRTHDFSDPQPLKLLRKKHIPDLLIKDLKSIYANKRTVRQAAKGKAAPKSDDSEAGGSSRDPQTAGRDSESGCSSKQKRRRGKSGRRGRGGPGHARDHGESDRTAEGTPQGDSDSDSSSLGAGHSKGMRGGLGQGMGGTRGNRRGQGRGNRRGGRGSRGRTDQPTADSSMDGTEAQGSERLRDIETGSTRGIDQNSSRMPGNAHSPGRDAPHRRAPPAGNTHTTDGSSNQQQRRQRDKTELCMYFIKGYCKHEEQCFKAHDKMPYRWEVRQSGQWTALADNEKIEKDYCDPDNTYSTTSPPVYFDTMTCKTDKVRRLSTVNSLLQPDFVHTTDWLWYWEDEYGKWYQYAAITSEHTVSSITSEELEERYLTNDKDVVPFCAGSQSYEISFQDMIQTNLKYDTKRVVRRRPQFVSAAEVQTKRKRPPRSSAVPDYWDKTQIPSVGFKKITLQPSSLEYQQIQDLFRQTMAGFELLKIERIQNKTVWEAFQLCKTHMKIKNGGRPVLEKKLFHGTDPKHVDTICEANFDWRVCGVNGTVYGQGSYFARDADYSHDYTGDCDPRFMFVSRVLVGDFARGSPEYRRPPSKDGGDVNLFDSCVNNVSNPSVFVVFREQQVYPEHLLQYRQTGRSNVYARGGQAHPLFTTRAYVPPAPPPGPTQTSTSTTADTQSSCVIA